jgi:carbon-monoxide dehydrogenase medium subunit
MMHLNKFEYLSPTSLPEVFELLDRYGIRAKLVAGGTDLIVQMKEKRIAPEVMINLLEVPELQRIERCDAGIRIGATVKLSALESSPTLHGEWKILASAAHGIGSPQVRNRGTIGGNLCNASPAADTAPSLLVMEAAVTLAGRKGERKIPLESFFTGPGLTVLRSDEIMKEITIPTTPQHSFGTYLKLGRRKSMDLALVSVAVLLTLNRNKGTCERARIALGSVAPTPVRARETEKMLEGKRPDQNLIQELAQCAEKECRPISDVRSTATYRKEMINVHVRKAILQALAAER